MSLLIPSSRMMHNQPVMVLLSVQELADPELARVLKFCVYEVGNDVMDICPHAGIFINTTQDIDAKILTSLFIEQPPCQDRVTI